MIHLSLGKFSNRQNNELIISILPEKRLQRRLFVLNVKPSKVIELLNILYEMSGTGFRGKCISKMATAAFYTRPDR